MSKAVRSRRAKRTSKPTSASRGSSGPPPFRRVLEDVARAFKSERWYLFGAQAVALHGVPRTTADVDVTVEPPDGGPPALVALLTKAGFQLKDVGDVATFVEATRILPFTHRATQVSLDVVLSGPGIEEGIHRRVHRRRLGRVTVRLIDINDLVTLKVLAARAKDLEDVSALVRAGPKGLDRNKVRRNLEDLERALDVSDLIPLLGEAWPARSARR